MPIFVGRPENTWQTGPFPVECFHDGIDLPTDITCRRRNTHQDVIPEGKLSLSAI